MGCGLRQKAIMARSLNFDTQLKNLNTFFVLILSLSDEQYHIISLHMFVDNIALENFRDNVE